jgi:hypothetical protein
VVTVLQGHLDAITSSGYVEGWAYDPNDPLRPLVVSVLTGGKELGQGIANLYRWDLVDAGCGTGWCAFRLRLSEPVGNVIRQTLILSEMSSRMEIYRTSYIPKAEDNEIYPSVLEEVLLSDPTLVHSINQLRGCSKILSDFIDAAGLDAFVRTAYIYILGRPVDASSLASDLVRLQIGAISPYEFLKALYDCEEFRSVPKLLIAPTEPGFAFQNLSAAKGRKTRRRSKVVRGASAPI